MSNINIVGRLCGPVCNAREFTRLAVSWMALHEPDCIAHTKVASILMTERAVFQTVLFLYIWKICPKRHMLIWLLCVQICVAVNIKLQSMISTKLFVLFFKQEHFRKPPNMFDWFNDNLNVHQNLALFENSSLACFKTEKNEPSNNHWHYFFIVYIEYYLYSFFFFKCPTF